MKRLATYVLASYAAFSAKANGQGGLITTVAGGGSVYPGDGGPATLAGLGAPVTADMSGNIFIAEGTRIRRVFLVQRHHHRYGGKRR